MVSFSWSLSDSYFINDATYRVRSKLCTSVNRVSVFLRRYLGMGTSSRSRDMKDMKGDNVKGIPKLPRMYAVKILNYIYIYIIMI